ncbi:hypothetical protein Tco_0512356 [Tanacetum coccineum]
MSSVHDTFHVSNLKKCLANANLHVPFEEIKVDKTLRFVEELEEIMDREVKKLKRSRIPIAKVRWNTKRGPEIMNPVIAQQVALDNALVAPENHVEIGKCNMRIDPTKTQKEATYQVVLDTLTHSPCYNAFLIMADVPKIYMHQFWFTISKIKDSSSYQFNLGNKKFRNRIEVFREVFQIYAKVPNQKFVEPPSQDEIVTLESVPDFFTDHMYQPWKTFASIINKCLSGKTTGLDKL